MTEVNVESLILRLLYRDGNRVMSKNNGKLVSSMVSGVANMNSYTFNAVLPSAWV